MSTFYAPKKTAALKKLEFLQKRKTLSQAELKELHVLQQGYEGELKFSVALKDILPTQTEVYYDLLLEWEGSYFQIDCLIVYDDAIYLLDIKNYKGNYYYENGTFKLLHNHKSIKNPLHQLERCETLLADLLSNLNDHYTIYSYLVFLHPAFTLYQAPMGFNIIYPGQLKAFLVKLKNQKRKPSIPSNSLRTLIEEKHMERNTLERLPVYQYEDLRKGLPCLSCSGQLQEKNKKKMQCKSCGMAESFHSAVLRGVIEYAELFPFSKITTRKMYDWCDGAVPFKRLSRIINKYMKRIGRTSAAYYEFW